MSEIKGQLLGIVMVLLIFGTVSGVVAGVFVKLKNTINSKSNTMITEVQTSLNSQESFNDDLLHFVEVETL